MNSDTARDLEKKLDKMMEANNFYERRKKLNNELKIIFNRCQNALDDSTFIVRIYIMGFDAIRTGNLEADQNMATWVNKIGKRSPQFLVSFMATHIIATLEDYIRDLTEYAKTNINEFRETYDKMEKEIKKDDKNKWLRNYLKPSGRKQWLKTIRQLYDIEINSEVEIALRDLIAHRQIGSHENITSQSLLSGENIKLWLIGTTLFIQNLIISVDNLPLKPAKIVHISTGNKSQ